jgi:predicted DNA-binding transcriptional regulator YafY
MLGHLEVSSATLKRDSAYMRDQLNVRSSSTAWRAATPFATSMREDRAELPGLWFSCKKCPPCPRELSPQRMLYFRDNRYLAAHCHVRNGLRVFSLDRMSGVQTLAQPALEAPTAEWAQVLQAGYGICNGGAAQTCTCGT